MIMTSDLLGKGSISFIILLPNYIKVEIQETTIAHGITFSLQCLLQ